MTFRVFGVCKGFIVSCYCVLAFAFCFCYEFCLLFWAACFSALRPANYYGVAVYPCVALPVYEGYFSKFYLRILLLADFLGALMSMLFTCCVRK
jgi:hypothetical protein